MYKYRSLEAWKRAHAVAIRVLRLTDRPCHPRARDVYGQLRRAAVSVEANIVEGYALWTGGHYLRHVRIALGSAAEAECLVRLAHELEYVSRDEATEMEAMLGATMRSICGILRRGNPPLSR